MSNAAGKRRRDLFEELLELKVPDNLFPEDWTQKQKVEIFKKAKQCVDVNGNEELITAMETLISDELTTADFAQEEVEEEWQDEAEDDNVKTIHVRMDWEDDYTEVYDVPTGGFTMDKTLKHIKQSQHFSVFLNEVPFERMQLWSSPRSPANSKILVNPQNIRTNSKFMIKVTEGDSIPSSSGKGGAGKSAKAGGGSSRQSTLDEFSHGNGNGNGGGSHEVISLVGDTEVVEVMDSVEEEISVNVYLESEPTKRVKVSFFPSLMSLAVFKERSFDALNLNTVEDCDVDFVSKGNNFEQLRRPRDLHPDAEVVLSRLKHFDFVDHKVPLIGKKTFTRTVDDYPDDLSKRRIQSVFSHYRKVGGDGNCFYRAVYLNLVEQLSFDIVAAFDKQDAVEEARATSLFHAFFQKLYEAKRVRDSPADVAVLKKINADLMEFCSKCRESNDEDNKPGNVLKLRVATEPALDEVLVRAARCIVAQYLEETSAAETSAAEAAAAAGLPPPHDISIAEVVMANFDGMTLEDFINQVVLMPARDAEDVIVIFASRAFRARICVWQLDIKADARLNCLAGGEGDSSLTVDDAGGVTGVFFGVVHLMLRGGHYDLLYLSGKVYTGSLQAKGTALPSASSSSPASAASSSSSSSDLPADTAGDLGADTEAAADAKVFALKAEQALALVKSICARLRLPISEAEEVIGASKTGGKKRERDEDSSQQESGIAHFDDPRKPASPLVPSNKKRVGASGSWSSSSGSSEVKADEGSKGAHVSLTGSDDEEEEVVIESGSAVYVHEGSGGGGGGGGGAKLRKSKDEPSPTAIPTRSARVPQNVSDGADDDARFAERQELQESVARLISEYDDSPPALHACVAVCSALTNLSKVSELAGTAAAVHSRSVEAMVQHALTIEKYNPAGSASSYLQEEEEIDAQHPVFSSDVMGRVLSLLKQWLDSDGSGGDELFKVASAVKQGVSHALGAGDT